MADILGLKLSAQFHTNIDKNIKIIFLVCDTALIEQQKNVISSNLGIEVGTIQGKKNKKAKSDLEIFRKMWDSYNAFVAIPNILYKLLSRGFIKISEINMIIFDECHHTDMDHPYNKIMNEFYFFYKKHPHKKDFKNIKLPRIIGLTASPLKSSIKGSIESSAQKAMEILSENLDSCIVVDPDIIQNDIKEENALSLEENNFIPVNSHNSCTNFTNLINIIFNNCLKELLSISVKDISCKYEEYKDIKNEFIEKYTDFIFSKFNS
jgi:ERCC4-related helicase